MKSSSFEWPESPRIDAPLRYPAGEWVRELDAMRADGSIVLLLQSAEPPPSPAMMIEPPPVGSAARAEIVGLYRQFNPVWPRFNALLWPRVGHRSQ